MATHEFPSRCVRSFLHSTFASSKYLSYLRRKNKNKTHTHTHPHPRTAYCSESLARGSSSQAVVAPHQENEHNYNNVLYRMETSSKLNYAPARAHTYTDTLLRVDDETWPAACSLYNFILQVPATMESGIGHSTRALALIVPRSCSAILAQQKTEMLLHPGPDRTGRYGARTTIFSTERYLRVFLKPSVKHSCESCHVRRGSVRYFRPCVDGFQSRQLQKNENPLNVLYRSFRGIGLFRVTSQQSEHDRNQEKNLDRVLM